MGLSSCRESHRQKGGKAQGGLYPAGGGTITCEGPCCLSGCGVRWRHSPLGREGLSPCQPQTPLSPATRDDGSAKAKAQLLPFDGDEYGVFAFVDPSLLLNEAQDHQRFRVVPTTVSSTSLFGMAWLVLSNETLQPRPLKSRIPVRENGAVDRKSASLGRWGVFMWQRRTKGLLCAIIFFGCTNSLSACAARRLLPPAPASRAAGRALQPTKCDQNTHQRPPQAQHRSSPTPGIYT